ncbi:hypothetical protein P879_02121 [Paragonimus westermani]|uniref:Uncharacterized protein n=1 Tax=Paragonimus westermani TaxID=34504 RepID=A0A8T0DS17_9TREM|nr:hypothetical protein P879_02121 [Paragonimus westermani]
MTTIMRKNGYGFSGHEPSQIKLLARNHIVYTLSEPTRAEVQQINYARRQFQCENEGLFAPQSKPFRALGHPVYLDSVSLVKSALGQMPRKPDIAKIMRLEEDLTMNFEDGFRPEGNEFPINEYDDLQLASDSIKKSTEPLRPLSGKHLFSSRETDSEPSPVNQFWSERAKYEQASRSKILPPNRKYLTCCTDRLESNGSRSGQPTSKDMTTQYIQAERLLEAEEAENDKLLTMEPEIVDLTQQIVQSGPSLLEAFMSRDSKGMLSSNSTPSSDLKKSKDIRPNFVSQSVERRRNRLQNQWFDEQPRPFTPRFLSISRPQVGPMLSAKTSVDTKAGPTANEIEHIECSDDDYRDHDHDTDSTKADESSEIKTTSSNEKITETTRSKQFSVL